MATKPRRHEDWPQRLDAAIAARASTRFRWGRGRHDCVSAAVALLKAMTGTDFAAGLAYGSRAEAEALIAAHGGLPGLVAAVARRHGLTEIDRRFAQRGDAGIVPGPQGEALAVIDLSGGFLLAPARVGWSRVPRKVVTRAWRIEA